MRFCDKLAKLRKNNNFSQEQLADKLGVSRQAVSKWESGSTYPDMEKMIQMCSILNCTLEELLDDGIIKENKQTNNKNNINDYLRDFLHFITKIYNMFCSMTFKDKMKCLLEVILMSFIVFLLGLIAFSILDFLTYNLISYLPLGFSRTIQSILESIYIIILLVVGIIIVVHLFKIRYLDYYITIEDKNTSKQEIEEEVDKKEYEVRGKQKVIIRDPKHSSFSFFSLLAKIVVFGIKIFSFMLAIPVVMFFLFLFILAIISLCHIKYALLFLFFFVGCIGAALLAALVVYFIYNFIFNRSQPLKIIFILFMSSLVLIASGIGLSVVQALNYEYVDLSESSQIEFKTEYINILDTTVIYILNGQEEYVIDNSLSNAKIEIKYPKVLDYYIDHEKFEGDDIYHISFGQENILDIYHEVIKNLKQKKMINFDNNTVKVKIYLSQDNYNRIMANLEK